MLNLQGAFTLNVCSNPCFGKKIKIFLSQYQLVSLIALYKWCKVMKFYIFHLKVFNFAFIVERFIFLIKTFLFIKLNFTNLYKNKKIVLFLMHVVFDFTTKVFTLYILTK